MPNKWLPLISKFCGSPNTFFLDSSDGEHQNAAPLAKAPDLITVSPASVIGGNSLKVTVRLPASSGGKGGRVELTSGNPSVVPLPASVEVPPGLTADGFTLSRTEFTVEKTSVVTSNVSVDISATYNGTTQTAVLVMPRISSTLSLKPASVIGGINSIGTLLLNEPAPKGGALVSLLSSDTATVTVPPSVIVAAKATTATFPIRTNPVANDVMMVISASRSVLDVEARLSRPVRTLAFGENRGETQEQIPQRCSETAG